MAKQRFTKAERQAYWIGVGISAARSKESMELLDSKNPKIRKSIRKGYQADNVNDISKRFR